MKPPRYSIVRLMVIVGIIALNLAAVRILFEYDSEMLIGVVLIGVVLQVGLLLLVRSRGRRRAFWGGFIVCGLMAALTLVWAMLFPELLGIRGGSLIRTPGSPLHTIWYGYANFASERIARPLLYDPRLNPGPSRDSILSGASIVAIRAVIWSVPQLFIAIVGGLLAGLLSMRPVKRPEGHPHVTSPIYS